MAHTIVAADLGGSSIKLARFEATFRKLRLLDTRVIPGIASGRPDERIPQQLTLLAQYLAQEKLTAEEMVLGLPGDALSFRIADLPFNNARQIESVLSYELESQILTPVEELALDFVIVGPPRGAGEGSPETRVLVAAVARSLVEIVVKTASDLMLPLRTIGAAPLAYGALLAEEVAEANAAASAAAAAATAEGMPPAAAARVPLTLVIDVGADYTNLCVLRGGVPLLARTVGRGGRSVTDSIAAAFNLDEPAAEKAKRDAGFIAHKATPRLSPSQAHMDAAVRKAVAPLMRELRQTVANFHATYGEGIDRVYLAGGGSRLSGLVEHVAEELGVEALPLPHRAREGWALVVDRHEQLAVALGMGLGTQHPATQVNFRKGEFAFRSDFSFVRGKIVHLAVALSLVLIFAALNTWAAYRGLRREHDMLSARLDKATAEVFGKKRDDLSRISEELKEGPKASAQVPIPSSTAFDLLEDMSRAAPAPDRIRLDFEELDIKPKKTLIKGTTETAQQVDDLADALKKVDCFEDVQKGKLVKRTVNAAYVAPGTDDKDKDKDKGPTELTQFTLTIKAGCP